MITQKLAGIIDRGNKGKKNEEYKMDTLEALVIETKELIEPNNGLIPAKCSVKKSASTDE